MYHLLLTPTARKNLLKIPTKMRARIRSKLDALCVDPFAEGLDIKKLKGESYYRLRVGDYRVVYDLQNKHITILVMDVGHRKEIYQ